MSGEPFTPREKEAFEESLGDFIRGDSIPSTQPPTSALTWADLRRLYCELIFAVATKHDDETRHETALRYITERESRIEDPSSEALPGKR